MFNNVFLYIYFNSDYQLAAQCSFDASNRSVVFLTLAKLANCKFCFQYTDLDQVAELVLPAHPMDLPDSQSSISGGFWMKSLWTT